MLTHRIRPSIGPAEYPALVEVWESAVKATHDFLSPADFEQIKAHLASDYLPAVELTVAEGDKGPVGFAGTLDGNLEMLFVDATHHGHGIGASLLNHAITEHGTTLVDVNEQNESAVGFYAHHGFQVVSRSEIDESGRPYTLLHLQLIPSP